MAAQERGLKLTSFPALLEELFLATRALAGRRRHARQDHHLVAGVVRAHRRRPRSLASSSVACRIELRPPLAPRQAGGLFVVEGDEYDTAFFDKGSKFLHYRPKTAILTSVELDHVDIFASLDAVKDAFRKFVALIPADGLLRRRRRLAGRARGRRAAPAAASRPTSCATPSIRRRRPTGSARAIAHAPGRPHAVRGQLRGGKPLRRLRHRAARRLQPRQRAVGDRRRARRSGSPPSEIGRGAAPLRRRAPPPGGARRRPGRHRRRRLRAPPDRGARDAARRCAGATAAAG